MNKSIDIDVVRTEALEKLGRNIVNFSKIEGILKYILSVALIDESSTLDGNYLIRNQKIFSKKTLGQLVQKLNDSVIVDDDLSKLQLDTSKLGISLSFNIAYSDSDFLNAQKQALSKIVEERNKLIHQDLALLDTSSVEDYHNLIIFLDEQNPRLLDHLEDLGWILTSFIDCLQDLQLFTKSPEFHQFIHSNQSDV